MRTADDIAAGSVAEDGRSGERLLLWGLRRCAFGCGDPRVVEAAFCDACGCEAGRLAYVGLRAFLVLLTLYGRRRLRLGPPGHAGATADERALLALFAAAEAGAAAELEARLAWLLRPDPAVDAGRIAGAVGRMLVCTPWPADGGEAALRPGAPA